MYQTGARQDFMGCIGWGFLHLAIAIANREVAALFRWLVSLLIFRWVGVLEEQLYRQTYCLVN